MVSIAAFQAVDPGSIPGQRTLFRFLFFPSSSCNFNPGKIDYFLFLWSAFLRLTSYAINTNYSINIWHIFDVWRGTEYSIVVWWDKRVTFFGIHFFVDNKSWNKRKKLYIWREKVKEVHRCEQDSNLRGKIPLDFESNALTTRPSQQHVIILVELL